MFEKTELLEYVKNNIEKGLPAGKGLYFNGIVSEPENISNIRWDFFYNYHVKKESKTELFNNFPVELGVVERPMRGQEYFYPSLEFHNGVRRGLFDDRNEFDMILFHRGFVYLEKELAQKRFLSLMGQDPESI